MDEATHQSSWCGVAWEERERERWGLRCRHLDHGCAEDVDDGPRGAAGVVVRQHQVLGGAQDLAIVVEYEVHLRDNNGEGVCVCEYVCCHAKGGGEGSVFPRDEG